MFPLKRTAKTLWAAVVILAISVFGIEDRDAQASSDNPVLGATRTAILIWLADEMGLFENVPIEIKLYASGTQTSRDLLAGSVNLATSSEFAFVSQALEHPNLRVVSSLSSSRTAKLVARKNTVGNRIRDLRGRRVAITRRSIGEYFLWQSLFLEGMSLDDVEVVDMRPQQIVEALADGTVDAALTWEPFVFRARRLLGEDAHVFDREAGHYYHFLLTGRAEWLTENRDTVVAVLTILAEAETFAKANPLQAKEMVAQRLGFDADFVDYLWPEHALGIGLSQDLLRVMEHQADWRIRSGLADTSELPDILNFIDVDPLLSAAPSSVQIIR